MKNRTCLELSNLSINELIDVVNGVLIQSNIHDLVLFLLEIGGNHDETILQPEVASYKRQMVRYREIVSVKYPIVAELVRNLYDKIVEEAKKTCEQRKWSNVLHHTLRELCVYYLQSVGCSCGKPFDVTYFEEDYSHARCEVYQKWAWYHIPDDRRIIYTGDLDALK